MQAQMVQQADRYEELISNMINRQSAQGQKNDELQSKLI